MIDDLICAEFGYPALDQNGELAVVITCGMVHGPCGSIAPTGPCMQRQIGMSGICSKRYPKEFQEETIVQEDGYPIIGEGTMEGTFQFRDEVQALQILLY